MLFLRKPDDILPILIGIFGIFIAFYCSLYTFDNLSHLQRLYLCDVFSFDISLIKHYADIISRVSFVGIIIYVLFLYYVYLDSMTLVSSIILVLHNVFYMGILANALPIPNVDFYPLLLISIFLWHCCFLMPKTTFYLIISSLVFMGIAYINPVSSICLAGALAITAHIIRLFNPTQAHYFYNIIFIVLCGFCSLTISLIKTKSVIGFSDIFMHYYHAPLIIICVLLTLIICSLMNNKPFIKELCANNANMMPCYGVIIFLGSVFIGRFDYIAHFS